MAKYKYKYNGKAEGELPTHGKFVKPGDVIETDKPINNPDFQLIDENVQEVKKQEVTKGENK